MNLIKNLNKKQKATIEAHNQKMIAKIINETEKVETSTRYSKWSQK